MDDLRGASGKAIKHNSVLFASTKSKRLIVMTRFTQDYMKRTMGHAVDWA